jgi:myosin heavy subunit
MSNPTDKQKNSAKPGSSEGNVDQIRDILFGGQMRDYERRFEELDERIKREMERMRADQAKRMEQIELLLKDHSDKAASQIKRVDAELRTQAEAQAQALDRTQRALRQELAGIDEKQEQNSSTLRERLHKLATETADGLRTQQNELTLVIEKMGTSLRDEKVAREELAGFFNEMALRLTRQFDLPKS